MFKLTLTCFIFLFIVSGCGGSDGSSGKKVVELAPEEMEKILNEQQLECREDPCPFGIARLFIVNRSDTSRSAVCTGFLVSGNRLVTNNHCVSSAEDCRNTFISVRTRFGPVKSRCTDLLFTESDGTVASERTTDLTVMVIEGVIQPPYFEVSSGRVDEGREVTSWVVDHVSLTKALISRLDCQYSSRQASLILRDCPAIAGNSGSPVVVKGTSRAFAILWGSNIPPTIDASFPFEVRKDLDATSLATELADFESVINGEDSSPR